MTTKTLHFRVAKDLESFYKDCKISELIESAFLFSFKEIKQFIAGEQASFQKASYEFREYYLNRFADADKLAVINLDAHSNSLCGNLSISRLYDPAGNFKSFINREKSLPLQDQLTTLLTRYKGYEGAVVFYDEDVCQGFLMHLLREEFSKVVSGKVLSYSLHEKFGNSSTEILDLKDFIYGSQVLSSGLCIQKQSLITYQPIIQVPYYYNKHLLQKFASIPFENFQHVRSVFFQISILYAQYTKGSVEPVIDYFNRLREKDYEEYIS